MAATLQLARKLTSSAEPSAEERALVAIDTQGAVISPLRRYAGRAAVYGALSILSGIGVCSLLSGDPLVLALSLVGTAAWGHGLLVTRWLEQASQLIHVARLDEAEALLLRCLRPPWGSEAVRGHAHLRLSTVASHRGQHDEALRQARLATGLFAGEYPPQPQFLQLSRYQEVRALVSLHKQAEARHAFADLHGAPSGDYLRAHYYLTELYLALGDGQIPFLDGPLWERAQLALDTEHAPPLLGLCAWGFDKLGDDEAAQNFHALCQKRCGERLALTLPLLAHYLARRHHHSASSHDPIDSSSPIKNERGR
ncbi:MAG: hypothetical protein JNM83_08365 [Myxococcales bacterium]|nr:hypothetical protein [Myxococcales bacterium]